MTLRNIFLVIGLLLVFTTPASAHLIVNASKAPSAYLTVRAQERNLEHARYFCKNANFFEVRKWHCKAIRWIAAARRETMWRVIAPWMPTYYCERNPVQGWQSNTGNGFYGGLQFDYSTWIRHGGRMFAARADLATPFEQVIIANRLTYDGWPHCPNP